MPPNEFELLYHKFYKTELKKNKEMHTTV